MFNMLCLERAFIKKAIFVIWVLIYIQHNSYLSSVTVRWILKQVYNNETTMWIIEKSWFLLSHLVMRCNPLLFPTLHTMEETTIFIYFILASSWCTYFGHSYKCTYIIGFLLTNIMVLIHPCNCMNQ